MTRKQRRLWVVLGGMTSLGVATALILTALQDNLVFFYSPSDVVLNPPPASRMLRIGGLVEENSVTKIEGDKKIAFRVTDGANQLKVVYEGVPPSLFREGQGVVAEGHVGADGVLVASSILAKHDEKYMPPEVADALKRSGRWNEGAGMPAMGAGAAPMQPAAKDTRAALDPDKPNQVSQK